MNLLKPHRLVLLASGYCVYKFAVSPMSEIDTMIWLLPGAVVLFFVGCIMGSFADDKERGSNATREGLIMFAIVFVITKAPALTAIAAALVLMFLQRNGYM